MNRPTLKFAIMVENSEGRRVMFSSHASEKIARSILRGVLKRTASSRSGCIVEISTPAALEVYGPLVPRQIIAGPYTRYELP